MELIERYVHEVGRRLPAKQRADVEAELRSLLTDALEARVSSRGEEKGTATEEDQVAVLTEFGPPAKIAAQYAPPYRYLIGPRVFSVYLIVVAAVSGAMTLAHLITLIVALRGGASLSSEVGRTLLQVGSSWFSGLIAGLGSVTLAFAILERVLPASESLDLGKETWDPRSLPVVEDRDRVKPAGLIAGIAVLAILIVVLNLYPNNVAMSFIHVEGTGDTGSRWISMPLLAPGFFQAYLPLLNVAWVLTIVLNAVLLYQGRWQLGTRIADVGLSALGVYIVYRMMVGPTMLGLNPDWIALMTGNLASAGAAHVEGLVDLLSRQVHWVLVLVLIITIVDLGHKIYLVYRTRSSAA
jgi:HAAS